MWSDWLVFCEYGFSVSARWCLLSTSTVPLGFLLPWTWDISSRLLQKSTAAAPYLGQGHPSWPWMWSSSSQPSCARTATTPWTTRDVLLYYSQWLYKVCLISLFNLSHILLIIRHRYFTYVYIVMCFAAFSYIIVTVQRKPRHPPRTFSHEVLLM